MSKSTPLYTKLLNEANRKTIRLHMPGHKGKQFKSFKFSDIFEIDYTELPATGNLYEGIPPISDAEALMAKAAKAESCFFLTGGSTQGIMTAISVACPLGSTIIVDRGSHRSVWNAMAHLDLIPECIFADKLLPWDITDAITAADVKKYLELSPEASAVVITSPSYYGVISDISEISKITKEYNIPLIVDEAHGAHLPFIKDYSGAIAQGANLSISSAHKTLPALTSGAFLFSDDSYDSREIRRKSSIFGTSSPSYPVMASMDTARAYMEANGGEIYNKNCLFVKEMRSQINKRGIFYALEEKEGLTLDPARLTINTGIAGLSGYRSSKILNDEYDIVCEMADEHNIIMIITCADSIEDLKAVSEAIKELEQLSISTLSYIPDSLSFPLPIRKLTPREAVYSNQEYLPLIECAGKIAGKEIAPYPPGIPIIAPGEEITAEHLEILKNMNFDMDNKISIISDFK